MTTIRLHTIGPARGSRHRRKVVGRGEGSGHGGSATRGGKGQTARSGSSRRPGFEGGQTPLIRRIPKRGFSHRGFRKDYEVVNVGLLADKFSSGAEVTLERMSEVKLVRRSGLVKILGDGEVKVPLTIHAHAFSEGAVKKITAAGGKAEKIEKGKAS